jgi:hypothetical protein
MPRGSRQADRVAGRRRAAYFLVSGLTMLAAVPFLALALVVPAHWAIIACLVAGLTLAFVNIGPSNAILTNVTAPRVRAGAVAVNLFTIHLLGDIPSPVLMGAVSDVTGFLFWGMLLTVPAMIASGLFFCWGTPYLAADEEAVTRNLRAAAGMETPLPLGR